LIDVQRDAGASTDRANCDVIGIYVPAVGAVSVFAAGEGGHGSKKRIPEMSSNRVLAPFHPLFSGAGLF
jgi:hypothetical protein